MSVIFTAKGRIIYETQQDLAETVTWLRGTGQMSDQNEWYNGTRVVPFSGGEHVCPDWNGLVIPFGSCYRNLNTKKLLENAAWATVITLAGPSDETLVRNAEHEVTHRINMENWFRENVVDETPHLGWEHDYLDEVWDPINITPPGEIKEQMRVKNASRKAKDLHRHLATD